MNAPTIKSNLPRFGMLVAMKLLLELLTIAELNDFFNCKVIICIALTKSFSHVARVDKVAL